MCPAPADAALPMPASPRPDMLLLTPTLAVPRLTVPPAPAPAERYLDVVVRCEGRRPRPGVEEPDPRAELEGGSAAGPAPEVVVPGPAVSAGRKLYREPGTAPAECSWASVTCSQCGARSRCQGLDLWAVCSLSSRRHCLHEDHMMLHAQHKPDLWSTRAGCVAAGCTAALRCASRMQVSVLGIVLNGCTRQR